MSTFSTLRDHLYTGYIPEPPRVTLMAWVKESNLPNTYRAEIVDADGSTRTAWVSTPGRLYHHPVPFSALQSVALCDGIGKVLHAFGRPPAATVPAWVEFAEVVA